ncbi:MAG: hypothetical protein NC131_15600 [Roseburia sp.]|nr:hypothetical protein [Roseburia sp.]
MIVASETRYVPVTPGYLTLQDSEGLYYYVHRTFFEQAVIMQDRYGDDIETLKNQIGGNPDFVAIEKFVEYVPKPINIMGYFLALLQEDIEDFEDIIGAMDVISTALNLRNLIKQPASIRQSVSFSVSIQNEYSDAWDLFFQNCYEYDWMKSMLSGGGARAVEPAPARRASSRASSYTPVYEEEEEEEEAEDLGLSYLNPDGSLNMEKYNEYMEAQMAKIDEEMAEDEANGTSPTPAAPAPAPSAPVSTVDDGGNGLGAIAAMKKRRAAL